MDDAGEVSPDAAYVADYLGVSVSEADRLLWEQARFGEVTAALRSEFPDGFAAAWVEYVPTNAFSVSFVGDVPLRAVQVVDEAGLDVNLVGGAPVSEAELAALSREISDALTERVGKSSFSAAADARAGIVSVTLPDELQDLQEDLPAIVTRDDVVVNYAEGPISQTEDTRGGARLRSSHTTATCTSGFSVENSNGLGGLVMAAHCDGTNLYIRPATGSALPMTYKDGYFGALGDVEWYTTTDIERPSIYDGSGIREIRDVFQPGEFFEDKLLCVYGRTTEYSCSRIYRVNANGCGHDRLTVMRRHVTARGDSGAPWFASGTAAGVHRGGCTLGGERRSTWSKAHLLPEMLGVHVRRQ